MGARPLEEVVATFFEAASDDGAARLIARAVRQTHRTGLFLVNIFFQSADNIFILEKTRLTVNDHTMEGK